MADRSIHTGLLIVALCAFLAPRTEALATPTGCLQTQPVPVFTCYETTFTSRTVYAHPIRDVVFTVEYVLPGTTQRRVAEAFWDGGSLYRARVALPTPGRWEYRIQSSDPNNLLQGQDGTIEVAPYVGSDAFRTRGWLRVSENQRHLVYADGTPFFWLSDTAWEMPAFSSHEQIAPYIADRKAKGFTLTSLVANSHQYAYPYHIRNRLGEPFLLNNDRSLPNPRYFDHLDAIIDHANAEGLAVALVPLWGTFAEPHRDTSPHTNLYARDEAITLAAYVGARYAGHNVVWIVGGDQRYDTEEKRAYWEAFARRLDEASGGTHLMAVHAGGYSGSFQGWPVAPDWLDLHMYQGSHIADIRYTTDSEGDPTEDRYGSLNADGAFHWQGGLRGFDLMDPTPILSAESNYEDVFSRFWELGSDTTGGQRIQSTDVRHAAYWGLLSGSTVGFTYGANGVWQWANEIGQGSFHPLQTVLDALDLPGSSAMTVLRTFAEEKDWHTWVPCPELVSETDAAHFIPASCGDGFLVLYAPTETRQATLTFERAPAGTIEGTWTHPVTGEVLPALFEPEGHQLLITPPDGNDWLLTLSASEELPLPPPSGSRNGVHVDYGTANPGQGPPSIRIRSDLVREATIELFDARGRRLYQVQATLRPEPRTLALPRIAAGAYFARVSYRAETGTLQATHLPITIRP